MIMQMPIYEGKAKRIYRTDNPDELMVYYKDDATAFNGQKKGTILNKGVLNNKISSFFFNLLTQHGIAHHFVRTVSEREMLVKTLTIIPIEVVVRNIAAGSLAKRLSWEEGKSLPTPVVEMYYKNDALGDPMINKYHVRAMSLATEEQLMAMEEMALKINEILSAYLLTKRLELIDFKLEFGTHKGKLLLGDEVSPDTCRFWDSETGAKMDKDIFRCDLGDVEVAYREVLRRLTDDFVE